MMNCTCDLLALPGASIKDGRIIQFELKLVKCQLCEAAPELLKSARAAWHLCEALLACREGVGTELIEEVRDFCKATIQKAEGRS